MTFDEIITPKVPEKIKNKFKSDLIFIYCYSILSTNNSDLSLLSKLDDALLSSSAEQLNIINEVKDEILRQSEIESNNKSKENNKEEIYL